jgi:putative RNA 2'-phosphotransferase
MDDRKLIQLSRFLCLVLRHKPEAVGVTLDRNGWVKVETLIKAVNRSGRPVTREILDEIVASDDKQRYAFSPDRTLIRASQGHSVDIDLGLKPVEPPEFLYHGTAYRFVTQIKQEGLKPRKRQYVHLSVDVKTAINVGSRHGEPVVLTILARQMHESGHLFHLSENNVWLTEHVQPEFLRIGQAEY